MVNTDFDDLRPYHDSEINAAMRRITDDPLFEVLAGKLYPEASVEDLKYKFRQLNSVSEFQTKVMHYAINYIVENTITDFSYNGLGLIDKNVSYLCVSNHRDILLDSALFELILYTNGIKTTEITFGSNLMKPDFVVDIGKSNKMFKVERGGNPRDFYKNSKHLSEYIRHTITGKKESIWIAQRNGRTKDGNDATDQGILKMFSMSGSVDLVENLSELNILPIAISYQWEPCDVLKVNEIYKSRREKYEKAPGEDLQSILTGITSPKGMVHIEITPPVTSDVMAGFHPANKNELISGVCKQMDKQIITGYRLFDTNYIACDLMDGTARFMNTHYSADSKAHFINDMDAKLNRLEGDPDELKAIYLGIYGNAVKNKELFDN